MYIYVVPTQSGTVAQQVDNISMWYHVLHQLQFFPEVLDLLWWGFSWKRNNDSWWGSGSLELTGCFTSGGFHGDDIPFWGALDNTFCFGLPHQTKRSLSYESNEHTLNYSMSVRKLLWKWIYQHFVLWPILTPKAGNKNQSSSNQRVLGGGDFFQFFPIKNQGKPFQG